MAELASAGKLVPNLDQQLLAGLYFWRDSNGNEVDVIAELGGRLVPIEIKAGRTVNREFFNGLDKWLALAEKEATAPALIHGGDENFQHRQVRVLGWQSCGEALLHPDAA